MSQKILISILNWNSAIDTIRCVQSVLELIPVDAYDVKIFVIDNASELNDYRVLKEGVENLGVSIYRNTINLGFAGGHNISLRHCLEDAFAYVWLLNNDAITEANTLYELIQLMEQDPRCGSCSPVIRRLGNPEMVDFCGAIHNWQSLGMRNPVNIDAAPAFCEKYVEQLWLVGTALLLRVDALHQVGLLNEKLFAYFEDDDIGVRLNRGGWLNKMCFSSGVEHACFDGVITERKPYYFYLMARNSFLFFLAYTPKSHRRLLRARLIDHALVEAEKLFRLGYDDKAKACLLGIADGLAGIGGPPVLNRRAPLWLHLLRPLDRWWNRRR
jgi:GT2 family glycosyltransferase